MPRNSRLRDAIVLAIATGGFALSSAAMAQTAPRRARRDSAPHPPAAKPTHAAEGRGDRLAHRQMSTPRPRSRSP
jgi:hypothetical protein